MTNENIFKVNDIVTGTEDNGYGITDNKCLLKVIGIHEELNAFDAELVAHKTSAGKKKIGELYENLQVEDFHLATQDERDYVMNVKKPTPKADTIKLGLVKIQYFEDGKISSNLNWSFTPMEETEPQHIAALEAIAKIYNKKVHKSIRDFKKEVDLNVFEVLTKQGSETIADNLNNFFKEFDYKVSLRFLNTAVLNLQEHGDIKETKKYITNYFKLMGHAGTDHIIDKIPSPEFTTLLGLASLMPMKEKVNNRIKVYFGDAGCGKTVKASLESEDRVVVIDEDVTPADLIKNFTFENGAPTYQKSILRTCMEEGLTCCLDEFQKASIAVQGLIQGITDNKPEINVEGEDIKIHKDFKLILTMNHIVGGAPRTLIEALVDRMSEIQEFTLTGETIVGFLCDFED